MKRWLLVLGILLAGPAQAETWSFALIGDVPYSAHERRELPRMLEAIADSNVAFVAHVGDVKHGQERCDDALFDDRRQLYEASRVPFVFVPGDNEWTDCSRLSNGAYDPLERLAKLRALFWQRPDTLGQRTLALERQPGSYPEHSRFRLGPVLFVTLNLPGPGNNAGSRDQTSAEFRVRNPQVLRWVEESFALARREKLAGIALLFQADPGFNHFNQGLAHRGFRDFLETVRREAQTFAGQVALIHGDSHISRIDHPLRDTEGRPLPNLVRVETFGYPLMGWTRGVIDSDSPALFRFETYPWPPAAQ